MSINLRRFSPLALALITLLGFLLRVIRLDAQPLWWDEGYSVFFSTRPFGEMLARTAVDIHPPLYYALLQSWIAVAGPSPVALRLLSVIIGTLTLPALFWAVRPLVSRGIALLAALLLALSPFHLFYSQEVRMYGLLTLCAVLSFGCLVRLLSSPRRGARVLWISYVASTAALLYVEYLGAFWVLAQVALVLWLAWPQSHSTVRPALSGWLFAWAAVLLLYAPWLIYAADKLGTYVTSKVGIEQYRPLDPLTFLAQHASTFTAGHLDTFPLLGWASLTLVFLAALGALTNRLDPTRWAGFSLLAAVGFNRRQRAPVPPPPGLDTPSQLDGTRHSQASLFPLAPVIFLLVSFALAYALNLVYPFHPPRYERLLLFALPCFLLLVAAGIRALAAQRAWLGGAAFGFVALVSLGGSYDFYTTPRYADEDYRPIISQLREHAAADDAVLAVYPWQIGYLESYWPGRKTEVVQVPGDAWINDSALRDQALADLNAAHRGVWLLAYQKQGRILEDRITNAYAAQDYAYDDWVGNTRLMFFSRGAAPETTVRSVTFAEPVTLLEGGAAPSTVPVGTGFVRVLLSWQTASNAYAYSLRLVNAQGQNIAQADGPVYGDPPIQRRGLFIPASAPPGQYSVRILVYRTRDAQPIRTAGGDETVVFGTVTVTAH